MSELLQGAIVALVVGISAVVVLRRYWPRRGQPSGCGACRACPGNACGTGANPRKD